MVKINAKERLVLMDQKYVYLQHTFNALKSQNVIEFLKNSLNQTEINKTKATIGSAANREANCYIALFVAE